LARGIDTELYSLNLN